MSKDTSIDLNRLCQPLRLDVFNPGSSEEEIAEMRNALRGVNVPAGYIDFITQVSEAEIAVGNEAYIRIWGAKGCEELNDAYHIQRYLPGALAIGDDEGGNVIFYASGNQGYGLYKTGFGNLIWRMQFIWQALYISY